MVTNSTSERPPLQHAGGPAPRCSGAPPAPSSAPDPPDAFPGCGGGGLGAGAELSRAEQSWQTLLAHVAPPSAAAGGGLFSPYPSWEAMADSLAERAAPQDARGGGGGGGGGGGLFSPYPAWQSLTEKAQAHEPHALYPGWEHLTERMRKESTRDAELLDMEGGAEGGADGAVALGLAGLGFGTGDPLDALDAEARMDMDRQAFELHDGGMGGEMEHLLGYDRAPSFG